MRIAMKLHQMVVFIISSRSMKKVDFAKCDNSVGFPKSGHIIMISFLVILACHVATYVCTKYSTVNIVCPVLTLFNILS